MFATCRVLRFLSSRTQRQTTEIRFFAKEIFSPIRHVSRVSYDGNVYNIETTENTYLVSNAIVHNCGKWFATDMERSLHTKLHYII